ncbi:MAG: terminase small subunit [Paraclostridium sp.]
MSKLNDRQKAFADYYVESLNIYDSALKAGYSESYAKSRSCELLENVRIKSYIDEIMNSKSNDRIASQDEILQILTDIARGITEEEVVSFSNLGEECRTTRKPTIKDRMKASELLGKRYRMWTDKVDIEITEPVTIIDDIGENDE